MDAALGASPYTLATAYNPQPQLAYMSDSVNTFDTRYQAAVNEMDYEKIIQEIKDSLDEYTITEEEILASVAAFSDSLNHEIETTMIPRFQRGMQDINAVQSSSFVLGKAMIEEEVVRKIAQYEADLRIQREKIRSTERVSNIGASLQTYMQMIGMKLSYADSIAKLFVETNRMAIVAYKEQYDKDFELDSSNALWDLEVFKYGGNLLASIGGGTAVSGANKPSQAVSALGGAMSGAAAGAQIGSAFPGYGTAIGAGVGAVVGGLAGAFS